MKTNPPGTILVNEADVRAAWDAVGGFDNSLPKAAALLHFLQEHFLHSNGSDGMAREKFDQLSVGVLGLTRDVMRELNSNHDASVEALRAVKGIKR